MIVGMVHRDEGCHGAKLGEKLASAYQCRGGGRPSGYTDIVPLSASLRILCRWDAPQVPRSSRLLIFVQDDEQWPEELHFEEMEEELRPPRHHVVVRWRCWPALYYERNIFNSGTQQTDQRHWSLTHSGEKKSNFLSNAWGKKNRNCYFLYCYASAGYVTQRLPVQLGRNIYSGSVLG